MGQEKENSKARKPSTSDGFFVIGRNVFSTREILVSLIWLAVNSYELGFETKDLVVKISLCMK